MRNLTAEYLEEGLRKSVSTIVEDLTGMSPDEIDDIDIDRAIDEMKMDFQPMSDARHPINIKDEKIVGELFDVAPDLLLLKDNNNDYYLAFKGVGANLSAQVAVAYILADDVDNMPRTIRENFEIMLERSEGEISDEMHLKDDEHTSSLVNSYYQNNMLAKHMANSIIRFIRNYKPQTSVLHAVDINNTERVLADLALGAHSPEIESTITDKHAPLKESVKPRVEWSDKDVRALKARFESYLNEVIQETLDKDDLLPSVSEIEAFIDENNTVGLSVDGVYHVARTVVEKINGNASLEDLKSELPDIIKETHLKEEKIKALDEIADQASGISEEFLKSVLVDFFEKHGIETDGDPVGELTDIVERPHEKEDISLDTIDKLIKQMQRDIAEHYQQMNKPSYDMPSMT